MRSTRPGSGLSHLLFVGLVMLLGTGGPPHAQSMIPAPDPPVATFSIVAFDPETGDLGVAVQSRFLAVGAVVPWARAGVGAIATQAFANTTYGPRGLDLLALGLTAEEVAAKLTALDNLRDRRQLGVVDARGRPATFTGEGCQAWAGGRTGPHYTVQGNILTGPEVVEAMARGYETATGDLASRMVAALAAGQAAGGDSRGKQSAAVLVVREGGGYGGFNDRYIDLRVDDHPEPIKELRRILDIQHRWIYTAEAVRLSQAGKPAAAATVMRKVVALAPEDGTSRYNLACFLSLSGALDEAMAELTRALGLEPSLTSLAGKDADLDPLRERADFQKLLDR